MKKLVLILGAAALAATTFNASATGLLAPRATGNEIRTVAGTATDLNLAAVDQGLASAPRATANRTVTAAGSAKEITPAMTCSRNMSASPKAIQACAANSTAAMPCCGKSVATAN